MWGLWVDMASEWVSNKINCTGSLGSRFWFESINQVVVIQVSSLGETGIKWAELSGIFARTLVDLSFTEEKICYKYPLLGVLHKSNISMLIQLSN